MKIAVLVLIAFYITLEVNGLGFTQSVAVKGRLMCNGIPAGNVKVKLYDVDTFDLDDLMAEGYSDRQGFFFLSGQEREFTSIDPKLNIYHDCNDGLPCNRKFSIVIPDSYVSEGAVPFKVYDSGMLNLDGKFSGESRDCLNR